MKNIKTLLLILLTLIVVTGCKKDPKCPDGYLLENDKCAKEVERIEAQANYECDPDTRLEDDTCVREIFTEPIEKNGCKEGLTEENGYCVGTLKEPAADGYKCNSGELNSKTNSCVELTYVGAATKTCNNEEDIVLDNGKCAAAHPGAHSYGEPGEVDPATECCCGDTFKDGWCYSLPDGNYDAKITCPSGSTYTSGTKGKACYKETTSPATSAKVCNKGYTLNGNECTKTVKEKVGKIVSCENGYNLDGNQCKKVEATPAKTTYTCPENFTNVDKYCVRIEIVDPK